MSDIAASQGNQFLSFKLDEEIFAINVASVREILDLTTVTRVPESPPFMRGVINLRGSVVPVMDLRLRFGMPEGERTERSCIIVTEMTVGDLPVVLGVLADSVQEVMDLEPDHIEPAPRLGTKLNKEFIVGMGRRDEQFIIILDIGKVFSAADLVEVSEEEREDLASNG